MRFKHSRDHVLKRSTGTEIIITKYSTSTPRNNYVQQQCNDNDQTQSTIDFFKVEGRIPSSRSNKFRQLGRFSEDLKEVQDFNS